MLNATAVARIPGSTTLTIVELIGPVDANRQSSAATMALQYTAGVSAGNASGTTYDGATELLTAETPVTAGAHTLYLSIFDQGDSGYDSAVLADNLHAFAVDNIDDCHSGVTAAPRLTTSIRSSMMS